MIMDDYSDAQIAPSGNFFNTTTINCDNPLLPIGVLPTIGCDATAIANGDTVPMYILRRNVEGGGRQQAFANSSFRAVTGVRGAINEAWAEYNQAVPRAKGEAEQAVRAAEGSCRNAHSR